MMLKEYPLEERPREKAKRYGFEYLSNVELIALIIRTGNKQESVMEVSQRIINELGGFQHLPHASYHQLIGIKGIKEAKAITLLAVMEFARRMVDQTVHKVMIREPKDAYLYIKNKMQFEKQEKVVLLCLNTHLEIVKEKVVFVGSDDMSVISGKEIFKEAFMCGSHRLLIIHNHPSGHPNPSKEDIAVTKRLQSMASELEMELMDHIIVGKNCFYSFASNTTIKM